jgi:hypothetical protein
MKKIVTFLQNTLPFAIIFLLMFCILYANGQTPHWNWAKSAGGNGDDYLVGATDNIPVGSMHIDTLGNEYVLIVSPSNSITLGSNTYTNASGLSITYLVKYNPQGIVLWAQEFPAIPHGGYVAPISMFTSAKGYSYVMIPFQDSLRLGSMVYIDTTIHFTFTGYAGYCIAVFDPNGIVISLKGHKSPYTDWGVILPFQGNHILALGGARFYADTLDGISTSVGSYLAVMDSLGDVSQIKNIGYDSSNLGNYAALASSSQMAIGGHSVYIGLTYLNHPVLNQSFISINNISSYIGQHLILKFDDFLNFQWFKACSPGVIETAPIYADQHDNVYLDVSGTATLPQDTLKLDTTLIILPYIIPIGQYGYAGIAKMDNTGKLQWVDLFVDENGGEINGLCTDLLNNIYCMGTYSSNIVIGTDTLNGYGNAFVAKMNKFGMPIWAQNTQNAQGHIQPEGLAEDGHGNVYINGVFYDSSHTFFGTDSIICHAPISGHPLNGDVLFARLGACSSVMSILNSSNPLAWCGKDSVVLSTNSAYTHLWSSGDTTPNIVIRESGLFYVLNADTEGCYTQSMIDTISNYPQPILYTNIIQEVLCKGGNDGHINLRIDSSTGLIIYNFSPPIIDTSHISAGSYIITATDSAGCKAKDTIIITEPASAISMEIDSFPSLPIGTGVAIITAQGGTPSYTYLWSNGLTTDTISNLLFGWYEVTVTDHNGCKNRDSVYIPLLTNIDGIAKGKTSFYPNPNDGNFIVVSSTAANLIISDIKGQVIMTQSLSNGLNNISQSLTSGTYLIEIVSNINRYAGRIEIIR